MSKPNDKERKALAVQPRQATYDVGYGKPPTHGRFKPGQSGNPKGRPRGAKNKSPTLHEERLKSIVLEEAYRTIKVNDGEKPVSVPMAQAVIRSLAVNAAKGNQRAQRLFTELLTSTERENARLHNEWLDTAITYKVEWEKELRRRERLGITDLPDPLPHPDHIVVDFRTNNVRIIGPMSKEEKEEWDMWLGKKAEFEAELAELEQMLLDDPETSHRKFIEDDIKHTKKVLGIINRVIG